MFFFLKIGSQLTLLAWFYKKFTQLPSPPILTENERQFEKIHTSTIT
ncbi:hypothetical protein HMPREF1110_1617 [Streptococcus mitis SK579]|nr:hypothetical protein HMPREF1110_1617 [Streptococcus mitis SK579]